MAKSKAAPSEFADDADQPVQAKAKKRDYFEEWTCQIKLVDKKPTAEKLKLKRRKVKINEQQAEVLNYGRLNGGNAYADLYFRPE